MKMTPQRGAARVSAVWLIVLLVLVGVEAAFIYVANQQATKDADAAATARASATEFEAKYDAELQKTIDVSRALGFRDANDAASISDLDAFTEAMNGLKAVIPDIESATSFEAIITPTAAAYRAEQSKVSTLTSQIATLGAQVTAKDAANRAIDSEKSERIRELESELSDTRQTYDDQVADLERRLADVTSKFTAAADALNEEKNRYDDLEQAKERDALAAQTRWLTINGQLDELRYQSEQPDASILAISKELNIGWINRGSADRVAEGMVFEVRTGNPNPAANMVKAFAEVTTAEVDRSLVRFYNLADEVDPPVTGDLLFNPVYQPGGERFAVLAGNFTGDYNEGQLKLLLGEIGINIQESLDLTTNYLIVGGPLFYDEDGEPADEPIQPSDLPVYKDAQAYGCEIISINDLRKYFRR